MAPIGQRTIADAVTEARHQGVDRTGPCQWVGPPAGPGNEPAAGAREIGRTTLPIEEWKHRFRRGDSDATTVVARSQHRASRVNAVGQATKSMRWMPWRQEPTKDVAGSEMLWGVASKR